MRYSLVALMVTVTYCCVSLVALRYPTAFTFKLVLNCLSASLAVFAVLAIAGRKEVRVFAIGFVALSLLYLAIGAVSSRNPNDLAFPTLVTDWLLAQIRPVFVSEQANPGQRSTGLETLLTTAFDRVMYFTIGHYLWAGLVGLGGGIICASWHRQLTNKNEPPSTEGSP